MVVVRQSANVSSEAADKAIDTKIQWLIDRRDGAPNFELRKFTIRSGGRIPKHYHPEIEHEQYVLKGNYTIGIGNDVFRVKAGDVLYIPAGTTHWYMNEDEDDAEFLCIVPKKEKYEAIYLEDIRAETVEPLAKGC